MAAIISGISRALPSIIPLVEKAASGVSSVVSSLFSDNNETEPTEEVQEPAETTQGFTNQEQNRLQELLQSFQSKKRPRDEGNMMQQLGSIGSSVQNVVSKAPKIAQGVQNAFGQTRDLLSKQLPPSQQQQAQLPQLPQLPQTQQPQIQQQPQLQQSINPVNTMETNPINEPTFLNSNIQRNSFL